MPPKKSVDEESVLSVDDKKNKATIADVLQSFPILWNLENKDYKNSVLKGDILMKLDTKFKFNVGDSARYVKQLKDSFAYHKKAYLAKKKSGSAAYPEPTWEFWTKLQFLDDHHGNSKKTKTSSNTQMNDELDVDNQSEQQSEEANTDLENTESDLDFLGKSIGDDMEIEVEKKLETGETAEIFTPPSLKSTKKKSRSPPAQAYASMATAFASTIVPVMKEFKKDPSSKKVDHLSAENRAFVEYIGTQIQKKPEDTQEELRNDIWQVFSARQFLDKHNLT